MRKPPPKAWGNPFAQTKPASGAKDPEEWDDVFSEESSGQVVYENDSKAKLISLYKSAMQAHGPRPLQALKETSSLQDSIQKQTYEHRLSALPACQTEQKLVSSETYSANGGHQVTKGSQLRSSQRSSLAADPARQSRRPSLDPIGSFDSPVGWDDAPQDDFDVLLHRQPPPAAETQHRKPEEAALENEAASPQPEYPCAPPAPSKEPVIHREGQLGPVEKGRSLLDMARETWARAPLDLDQAGHNRGFAENPFRELGSLGMGWSQQFDQAPRAKPRKATQRPKFSIRPQHRPSLTQAKANVGAGMAPLAQRLKQLAECSEAGLDSEKLVAPLSTFRGEESELDDIEDQGYHFADNEAALPPEDDRAMAAEDIDVDEEEEKEEPQLASTSRSERLTPVELAVSDARSGSPMYEPEPFVPFERNPMALVPVDQSDVRGLGLPEQLQAGTSGRDLTSQFRNALHAAEGPQSALATQADWGTRQPVGVLAQLQRALQRQRTQEALFAKALQTGQAFEHDVRACLDVRILETAMEAHLLKCLCEVLHQPEDPGETAWPSEDRIFVLFNRKSQHGAVLEPGRVVRISPPWQHLVACGEKKVVFNAISYYNLR